MPSGHTQVDTINKRRPLTDGHIELLKWLRAGDRAAITGRDPDARIHWSELEQGEKNRMRSLCDRGMARISADGSCSITGSGETVLLERPEK